jgi:hypothetical protein
VFVGRFPGGGGVGESFFGGEIDEVQIFDRALSAPEIAAIVYASGAGTCALNTATALEYVGPASSALGSAAILSARLTDDSGGTPFGGHPLTFAVAGAATQVATTDAAGVASVAVSGLALGPHAIEVTFSGSPEAALLGSSIGATLIVVDATPPVLGPLPDITIDATDADGAVVSFASTATDNVDGAVPVACTPASGDQFPSGTTTVECSAADAAGNSVSATFTVHVTSASELMETLTALGATAGLQQSAGLLSKAAEYAASPDSVNQNAACNGLNAFQNQVRAQSGKKITAAQATELRLTADRVGAVIGCS